MSNLKTKFNAAKGFTLLEILLVVGIISILAGIVILAINPTKQLGDTRNAQRRSDVLTILNAVYQYSIDNNGDLTALALEASDTCDNTVAKDASTTDIVSALVGDNSEYLVGIPHEPQESDNSISGYSIVQNSNGRITVCAPGSLGEGNIPDDGNQISVTR